MNAARFNRHIAEGRARAEGNLAALERAYHLTLTIAARHAADRFEALSTDHLVADATDPKWTPPENDQLLDPDAMAADAQKRTKVTHRATLRTVVGPALADVGIAYDVSNPLISGLIDKLGVRAEDMGAAVRGDIASAVLDAYQQGLSVPDTAAAIRAKVEEIAPSRATMLARTDLVGLANGASMAAAQIVAGADTGGEGALGFKSWLATEDERTRESHADADGQIVPLDQSFDVGGEQLAYPGDPDGSDEQVANCRCTLTYLDAAEAAGETGDSDLAMAASGESPTDAVASQGHMDASPLDTTAAVTVTVGEDSAAQAASAPVRWQAVLCVEGEPTEDGRMLEYGSITWRELPLSLGVMFETPHSSGSSAEIGGRIDNIWRDGNRIMGSGVFTQDTVGTRAAEMVAALTLRGISVDLGVLAYELREANPAVATDDTDESGDTQTDIADVITEIDNLVFVVTEGVIGAATVCPYQAIAGATISVVASAADGQQAATVDSPTCFVLTASAPAAEPAPTEDRGAVYMALAASASESAAASLARLERDDERRDAFQEAALEALAASGAANEALLERVAQIESDAAARESLLSQMLEGVGLLVATSTELAQRVEGQDSKIERLVASIADDRSASRDAWSAATELLTAKLAAIGVGQNQARSLRVQRDADGNLVGLEEE